ncbi:TadE/TadG family type IV pilus assembly protein [Caulobacter sp. X]|uniref:TadE/TadG family type IV pilus assembly protein n=1 Tax=Caulobacter sp. X TaxID=2048901 RepID=UPI000C14B5D1|nr:TadE/TadG family type IV pilus assembly protein [Caulobacter sp. X]PIC01248.1 pilus assembly protein TadE [Caulobacter sp. X]
MRSRRPSPRRFWRDRRGASAVEFALIAPVLILMYCGMAELTQAMMAQRRVSNITSSIGDLTAQASQTGPARTTDIFNIGAIIMTPFPTSGLKMCLASIVSDANGKNTVAWSRASEAGMTNCPAQGAVLTDVPKAVLSANKSVILARVAYVYSSPIQLVLPKPLTFNRTLYLRPRRVDAVLWSAAS